MINELPKINIEAKCFIYMTADDGSLVYEYSPFYNKKIKNTKGLVDLDYLTLDAEKAGICIENPIDIDIEESYDGSANMTINDRKNPLKIVNSRFYLTDSLNYKLGDRKGNLDTNIYTEENFKTEANLIKSVQTVVSLDFDGLLEGGKMPVGSYSFYFKLSDADGHESDFISESGKVVCHIGNINQPKFIRGGQMNEDSGKSIKFKLNNLDLAYNFINVYYTRSTGDNEQEIVTAHKIHDKFKINGGSTNIIITGYEQTSSITMEDINIRYSEFNSVRTLENCQNITFAGGIKNDYELFKTLEQYSLYITPRIASGPNIGNLSQEYGEKYNKEGGYEYFNTKNIYYKLGYWEHEIYRLGIVYIMNDYTLSPVFNIRGIKELSEINSFTTLPELGKPVNFDDDYIIENSNGLENSKGVFKIDSQGSIFSTRGPIKPIGIQLDFTQDLITGGGKALGLQDITKGFFVVRQKRIPTILAQAIGISTTKKGHLPVIKSNNEYIAESFLSKDGERVRLGSSFYTLTSEEVVNNALLCPEADLRTEIYNNYFNSSEYLLMKSKYQPVGNTFKSHSGKHQHYLDDLKNIGKSSVADSFSSSLLLVENGIDLLKNNENKFSSKAGDESIAHKHTDIKWGDYADPKSLVTDDTIAEFNVSNSKIRGTFNTYIGCDTNNLENCVYYDIYQKGYDFSQWRSYFKHRFNDASPFFPISDRMMYEDFLEENPIIFGGDCYINTFTHKMNNNFIDPELPTNKTIVDSFTWYKHFRVTNKKSIVVKQSGEVDETTLSYNKLLPTFTYRNSNLPLYSGDTDSVDPSDVEGNVSRLLDAEDKHFKKYSERNGIFGYEKLNRPDINAVGLGHWVTYKICSNINLAMRDVDLSNPTEEATHGMKRSFYPLQSIDKDLTLPESNVINKGISKSTGDKLYFEIPDVPFIKNTFPTRVYFSNVLQQSSFVNGSRTFFAKNYQDYTMEYGAIVNLVEWYGSLIAIMEHGVLQIPVNERAMMKNEAGENVYINTDTVLPKNPRVLSNTFGSLWPNSIVKTSRFIYGLDTVGKKIWRTNGEGFDIISDLKIQKFLNDNIHLKESDNAELVGTNVMTTHYNAFKGDIMFTFKYGDTKWHICWNELLEKWVTRYSWYPEFSENINNIFYTFANKDTYKDKQGILYKHGFAGTLEQEGEILPTKWYDKQEPFEFEFVVAPQPGVQKIYNNFDIISNNVEPNSFIYEIVGDSYDWSHLKSSIEDSNEDIPESEDIDNAFNYMFNFPLISSDASNINPFNYVFNIPLNKK